MPALRDLQLQFLRMINGETPEELMDAVCADGIGPSDRLSVFRDNSASTHTDALAAAFPVVRRLVDPRFFAFAVHEFLLEGLPRHPCLSEFGAEFPDFLARFGPARALEYLPDVARLEWAIHRVSLETEAQPIPLAALAAVHEDPAALRLKLNPGVRYLSSSYPVDTIWAMNLPEEQPAGFVLEAREVYLEVRRRSREPVRRRSVPDWIFRSAIARGSTLGEAVEAALRADLDFELRYAIAAIFADELIVGIEQIGAIEPRSGSRLA